MCIRSVLARSATALPLGRQGAQVGHQRFYPHRWWSTDRHGVGAIRIVQRHPWPQDIDSRTSAAVWLCEFQLSHNRNLAGIKHLNRLEQVLAAKEVNAHGFDEGLLCDN